MTHATIHVLCLLAARQDLHRVWGRFDHQRPGDATDQMIIIAGLSALVALVLLIWLRGARPAHRHFEANSPRRLFHELCHAHGLRFSSRRLLKRLAAARGLAGPALLFIEPKYFDPSSLPPSLKPAANDLQRLRHQLFG
ncbi:MAG: hypothetical protein WD738_17520 [Pirellulales bacterium]